MQLFIVSALVIATLIQYAISLEGAEAASFHNLSIYQTGGIMGGRSSGIVVGVRSSSASELPLLAKPTAHIIVGDRGNLSFSPNTLNATVGTTLRFNFLGLNHTLTQSRFGDPCRSNGQFNTGFNQFNPANISGKFLVDYEVKTHAPQWFYCAQTVKKSHCHAGMVFSLNAGGAGEKFMQNALGLTSGNQAPLSSVMACSLPRIVWNSTTQIALTQPTNTGAIVWRLTPTSSAIFPPIANDAGIYPNSYGRYMGIFLGLLMV